MLLLRLLVLISSTFLAVHGAALAHAEAQNAKPSNLVDLGYARYQGHTNGAGVNEFLGMRYAAPPVGNLRFRAPADPVPHKTIQAASAFGPICFGPAGYVSGTSEDCLFINVFAPPNVTAESKLPVWFYIQGGGYAADSQANYNGTDVVLNSGNGLIFVNLNYRVGSLGFLASENVRKDGDLNAGLLDQRKALHWVQQHIAKFGGDPDHVVIHGSSAGAGSIVYQMTAYGGRNDGLFVGGMSESPFFPYHPQVSELEFQFNLFAKNLSCSSTSTSTVMQCLRSKSTAEIAGSTHTLAFPGTTGPGNWYWLPVVDGNFSKDLLYNELENGHFVKVPVVVGDDLDEGNAFAANAATNDQFLAYIKDNYPKLTADDLAKINATYPLMPPLPQHNAWYPSAAQAYGESTFTCPGNQIAASVSKYVGPDKAFNYLYNVTDVVDASQGDAVPHVAETVPIFGVGQTPNAASCGATCSYRTYNAPIVPIVMSYWISFVKHLTPNTEKDPSAPFWQGWGSSGSQTPNRLQFILTPTMTRNEFVPKDLLARCDLWRGLATQIEQ